MSIADSSARRNFLLLIQLRWLAVAGQVLTILFVGTAFGLRLPEAAMLAVCAFLAAANLYAYLRYRSGVAAGSAELFAELLLDIAVLTVQLYLSGGATNPFVSLYLLHVILGAVLFDAVLSWAIVAITGLCYLALTLFHRDIMFPHQHAGAFFNLHLHGMFVCFLLAAVLAVAFINRINENLRRHNAALAELRRQAAEEEGIVRIGLLASGAAHELGTPLATLSVLLNDWQRMPALMKNAEVAADIVEMQAQLARCKTILSGVLVSAGELRGEGTLRTSVNAFVDEIVGDWRAIRSAARVEYRNEFGADRPIVSDTALRQVIFNVFDNAVEASPDWIGITVRRNSDSMVLSVLDRGPGFEPDILSRLGQPYRSTKGLAGSGLGLFLVFNVVRKLGGRVDARNRPGGGAVVDLVLPLLSLSPGAGA